MQLDLLLTVDWEYLNRFLSVNMLGALNCVRACYPALRERGGGAIVNQSSTAAYLYAGFYGLAKAGVNSLTQQLAHELGGQHIRINAIAPGPIDTEASRTVVPDSFMQPILAGLALKRQGETTDLVGMCLFLLSDEASWITGPRVQRRRRPGGPSVTDGPEGPAGSAHRVEVEDADGVRLLAFDRPEVRNAFDAADVPGGRPAPWPTPWPTTGSTPWC